MADVQAFKFEDDGETPNNPRLALVVYRAAIDLAGAPDPAAPFERAFARHATASIPSCTSIPSRTRCWASRVAAPPWSSAAPGDRC
jgi:hypothetical protein